MNQVIIFVCGIILGILLCYMYMRRKSVGVIELDINDVDGQYMLVKFYGPIDESLYGRSHIILDVDISQE